MNVLAVILVAILAYALGYGAMMRKVISGWVDISGRRYECRDVGPADK